MPKRIVDGEGLWRSDKLAEVLPPWIKAEYANLIPLAMANGSFEANTRRIWSTVYSYNRPEITTEQVEQILVEFERAKLLFRWLDKKSGKPWGYWTRIDKPGRLPGKSRRGRNEVVGLEPPAEQLSKFMESNGIHEVLKGDEKLLGSGSGFGSGINPLSEQKGCSDEERTASDGNSEPSYEARSLAALLKFEIVRNKCDHKITQTQERNWAITADRMLRLDGRSVDQIASLIRWTQQDEFWMTNVLSMDTLRKKFDQLALKMKSGSNHKVTTAVPLPANYIPASEEIRREQQREAAVAQ